MASDPDEWLSIGQAAAVSGLSTDTLRRYSNAGHIPSARTPGGQRRFRRDDVEALLSPEETRP